MHKVADLLALKGRAVHTIDRQQSVATAAEEMLRHQIGSLVVVDDGDVRGIVTRHDVVRAVGKGHKSLDALPVDALMSTAIETTHRDADLAEIRQRMIAQNIRHMPVLDGPAVVGLITLADVLYLELDEASAMNEHLSAYMFGPYF